MYDATNLNFENRNISNRVFVRNGKGTCPMGNEPVEENIIGWFANKYNPAHGWTVAVLDEVDEQWMEDHGLGNSIGGRFDINGIYRITSEKGTSIAWFDFDKGWVRFFDNETYVNTDVPSFQRWSAFDRFFFDEYPHICLNLFPILID